MVNARTDHPSLITPKLIRANHLGQSGATVDHNKDSKFPSIKDVHESNGFLQQSDTFMISLLTPAL